MPNDKPQGARIEWRDGEITQAFKNGEWVLLDNLNQAEASVLERMNLVMVQTLIGFFTPSTKVGLSPFSLCCGQLFKLPLQPK